MRLSEGYGKGGNVFSTSWKCSNCSPFRVETRVHPHQQICEAQGLHRSTQVCGTRSVWVKFDFPLVRSFFFEI